MRDQLVALAKLSEIDSAARELDTELQQIPARMAEMKGDVRRLEELLSREREHLAEAERLKKEQETEIARGVDMLGRSKAKAAKARNAREAEAVERELETIRRTMREREAERDRLGEAIEAQRASLTTHEGECDRVRGLLAEEESKAAERVAELEAKRSQVVQGRDVVAEKVRRPFLQRYETIRQRRGIAVVEAREGRCTGCQMQIPAQQYIAVQRAETLEQCPHCVRILYHKSAIED